MDDPSSSSSNVEDAGGAPVRIHVAKSSESSLVGTLDATLTPAAPSTASDGVHKATPPPPWRRWAVLFVSCFGVLLASIQTSALIIAFPVLIIALETPLQTMLWVLLTVMLVIAAIVPLTGKLGDMFGQATLFKFGWVVFTISTLLSGFATPSQHGNDLVAYRAVMGLGAAFLFTNSNALIVNDFAPFNQVGLAQGIYQIFQAAGTVIGPVIGGGFAVLDWRWIFFFNVPLGALCIVLAFISAHDVKRSVTHTWSQHAARFDWGGCFFIVASLLLGLVAMTQAVVPDPLLSSPGGLAGLILGCAASFGLFWWSEKRAVDPVVPMRLFNNSVFSLSVAAGAMSAFARGSVTYNMIFFYQGPYGQDAMQAGIKLIPFGLGIMLSGFAAGAAADRVGVRNLSVLGSLITAAGVVGLALITPESDFWLIAFALLVVGIGNGIFNAPNGLASMMSVPPADRGVASAMRMLIQMVPMMIGICITFAFVLNSMTQAELIALFIYGGGGLSSSAVTACINALRLDYYIIIGSCVASAVLSAFIPGDFKGMPAAAAAATASRNGTTTVTHSGTGGDGAAPRRWLFLQTVKPGVESLSTTHRRAIEEDAGKLRAAGGATPAAAAAAAPLTALVHDDDTASAAASSVTAAAGGGGSAGHSGVSSTAGDDTATISLESDSPQQSDDDLLQRHGVGSVHRVSSAAARQHSTGGGGSTNFNLGGGGASSPSRPRTDTGSMRPTESGSDLSLLADAAPSPLPQREGERGESSDDDLLQNGCQTPGGTDVTIDIELTDVQAHTR